MLQWLLRFKNLPENVMPGKISFRRKSRSVRRRKKNCRQSNRIKRNCLRRKIYFKTWQDDITGSCVYWGMIWWRILSREIFRTRKSWKKNAGWSKCHREVLRKEWHGLRKNEKWKTSSARRIKQRTEEWSCKNMKKQIYDEKNGLSYTLHRDYYLPDLDINEEEPAYGKYGIMRKQFLKEHRSAR